MHRSGLSNVIFCVTLVALVLSPGILSTRAVTAYLPAAMPGQFAQYKVLKDSCQSSIPQLCQSLGSSLNDTAYAAVQVVGVSGPAVILELISIFKNGTGAHEGVTVNVATGTSNVTAFSQGVGDYFLLAGGLQAPDQIWSTASARSLSATSSEIVLGTMRAVNFLNFTVSGSQYGTSYSGPAGFAFDRETGFLIEFSLKLSAMGTSTTEVNLAIGMVDNNLWGSAHMPDFDLSANPTIVSVSGSTFADSTITLHRLYGFSATVSLTATPLPGGASCSFSPNRLPMGGSDTSTVSCTGSPGTYTVLVEGNGGYSMHNTTITVTIRSAPVLTQPAGSLPIPLVYAGIGVVGVVAALVAFLFLRRKQSGGVLTPGDALPPAVQA